ncbi:MAG: OmpA family protein [Treponema sp.]|jgi:outer membrane protein OmpA-like peptidoglycan-associated protein|nr:OmpA family protein [Treponema sp.]
MAKKVLVLFIFGISFFTQKAQSEVFEYKHIPGSRYRILSVVDQAVFFADDRGRRVLNHRAEILNRIAVEVTDVIDGKGRHEATFQTSERIIYDANNPNAQTGITGFQWSREYESVFERDRLGFLTIDPKYFMPVVRNVPVFPDRALSLLERWSAEGHEVHDFRDSFGIEEPYRIPFTAGYQYLGEREWKEETYPAFSVSVRISSRPPAARGRIYPVRITGSYDQIVYWDRGLGQAVAYEEVFNFAFQMSDGRNIEYRGTAHAEFIEAEYMDKEQLASEIIDEINRMEIPDVSVRAVEEGISIVLENIGFYPDTAVMLPGELEKLNQIIEILGRFADRDIMVSGHTALAGTVQGRMNLSIERARSVADYLLSKNVRTSDRIVIRGFGAEKPIADNNTQEGMSRNRRVEITILEN